MRALVTGGAGFIGSHLAKRLAGNGHQVTVFDDLSRPGSADQAAALSLHERVTVEVGDVRSLDHLGQAIRTCRPEFVVHLAGQTAVTHSLRSPAQDFDVNALGTIRLLDAVRLHAPDALVLYASTNKVYGDLPHAEVRREGTRYAFTDRDAGIGEDEPFEPRTPYGCSKATGDLYVREYAASFGLRGVVLRQSCIYGPYDAPSEDQGWVGWLVAGVCASRPLNVYGDGFQVRDLLWVDDLLDLYERIAERPEPVIGQALNVGGGPAFSLSVWAEFSALLGEVLGRSPAPPTFLPWRQCDQRCYTSDLRKVTAATGWRPRVAPRDGIEALVSSVLRSNGAGLAAGSRR